MNKAHALLLAMIMMSVSLAGCLDSDGLEQTENACNELDLIAHEVTISYVEFEFESFLDGSPRSGVLYLKNADSIYLENATQVLANGQIYDLNPNQHPYSTLIQSSTYLPIQIMTNHN